MTLSPTSRKIALTAHVAASVGWLGAVAAFLALAVAALATEDPQTVRSVNVAMELSGWSILVPLSVASLVTGVIQALGTAWGLFRHYWVVTKLVLNVLATTILLLYMRTLSDLADFTHSSASPVLHSAAALVLLLTATVLAIFKPRGTTRWGRRAVG